MIVAAVLFQAADALTFAACLALFGPADEINPIVGIHGPGVVLAAKATIMTVIAIYGYAIARRHWGRKHQLSFGVFAFVGAIGALFNSAYLLGRV